jgi:hypothetical protein
LTLQKKKKPSSPQNQRPPESTHASTLLHLHLKAKAEKEKKKKKEKRQRKPTASARTLAPARAAFGPLSGKPA